jgi:hypothetical protein
MRPAGGVAPTTGTPGSAPAAGGAPATAPAGGAAAAIGGTPAAAPAGGTAAAAGTTGATAPTGGAPSTAPAGGTAAAAGTTGATAATGGTPSTTPAGGTAAAAGTTGATAPTGGTPSATPPGGATAAAGINGAARGKPSAGATAAGTSAAAGTTPAAGAGPSARATGNAWALFCRACGMSPGLAARSCKMFRQGTPGLVCVTGVAVAGLLNIRTAQYAPAVAKAMIAKRFVVRDMSLQLLGTPVPQGNVCGVTQSACPTIVGFIKSMQTRGGPVTARALNSEISDRPYAVASEGFRAHWRAQIAGI